MNIQKPVKKPHIVVVALAEDAMNIQAQEALSRLLPTAEILVYPDCIGHEAAADCSGLLVWKPTTDLWAHFPNLQLIQCSGAGVEQLLPRLSWGDDVAICRFVDPELSHNMANYVLAHILADQQNVISYNDAQQRRLWKSYPPRTGNHVVILGMGEIGRVVAERLASLGFQVSGWSRSVKQVEGIPVYIGQEALVELLPQADYVVNLLPYTPQTEQLVDKLHFAAMSAECCFINVGRGGTIDESALLDQLDAGLLRKAILDVFVTEPLENDSRLWSHPRIVITPHVASISNLDHVAALFADNLQRITQGEPPRYQVDATLGY